MKSDHPIAPQPHPLFNGTVGFTTQEVVRLAPMPMKQDKSGKRALKLVLLDKQGPTLGKNNATNPVQEPDLALLVL